VNVLGDEFARMCSSHNRRLSLPDIADPPSRPAATIVLKESERSREQALNLARVDDDDLLFELRDAVGDYDAIAILADAE